MEHENRPSQVAIPKELKVKNRQTVLNARVGEGVIGYTVQTGEEYYVPDVHQDVHYRFIDSLPETQSEVAFPLKIDQRVLGILDIQSDQLDAFHELDRTVLRALADNIATAVEGARLYSDVQRRAEQISAVFEITHALTSILDLDTLLETVVETIQKRFGYPFVHLYSVHPGRRLIFYWAGSGPRRSMPSVRRRAAASCKMRVRLAALLAWLCPMLVLS